MLMFLSASVLQLNSDSELIFGDVTGFPDVVDRCQRCCLNTVFIAVVFSTVVST